ncbi:MAG TPA: plastocyanin/azurin family copper-binding protein [Longimicrobiales bacterium]|nr:plastocyanin/azurin family copper-binding protein [Longimicrobiales bacterium]
MRGAAAGAGALALLLAACFSEAPDSTAPGDPDAVVIEMTAELTFSPAHVEVRAGQTVRWVNTSPFVHTATGDPARALLPASVSLPAGAEPWDSGDVAPGASWERVFTTPGEYGYFCVPHEGAMSGTLRVLP